MSSFKRMAIALVPLAAVAACTTLSEQDRAAIEQAKQQSAQALTNSQQAQATANQAAAEAKAAEEKADRMFQRSLRK